jgi:hypothetical protein
LRCRGTSHSVKRRKKNASRSERKKNSDEQAKDELFDVAHEALITRSTPMALTNISCSTFRQNSPKSRLPEAGIDSHEELLNPEGQWH